MGRKAGVTAEETRATLLEAAAAVFARDGFEGASIADIAASAGLSTGAIYAHYDGKADLFAAIIRDHAQRHADRLMAAGTDLADAVIEIGATFDRRTVAEGALIAEAIMVAKRDPEIKQILSGLFSERMETFAGLVRDAQRTGGIREDVDAEVLARLSFTISLGSLLAGVLDLPPTSHDAWVKVMSDLVDTFRAD